MRSTDMLRDAASRLARLWSRVMLKDETGGEGEDPAQPFVLVKFLSWASFLIILGTSLVLAWFITDQARQTLLSKQQRFATLLAENLNHQIFQRFTLPTLLRFGRIELQNPEQYAQLDRVINNTTHGLHVQWLRIYDFSEYVSYATDTSLVGRKDLADHLVNRALEGGPTNFEIISKVSPIWGMFSFDLAPESVVLRTIYTLRAERSLVPGGTAGQVMGVLEFTQDITEDYVTVVNFQWLIVSTSLVSSAVLFVLLLYFIRRAARVVSQRAREQRRLERELHQSERLASMGRVVAGIAHEIRNPLGIIKSSAQLLLRKAEAGGADPSSARILQAMYDESSRLSQTVNDFLDYARPRKPRQDPANLAQVLEQALVFLEHEMKQRGVAVTRDYPAELQVLGDKDLLYRAFYNILSNAMQAMDGAGAIRIMGAPAEDGGATLAFEDSGPGFDPDTVDKLADPFFTTKDHGTGLGLAIVSTILDSHGATLAFSNTETGGARVLIRFPAQKPAACKAA